MHPTSSRPELRRDPLLSYELAFMRVPNSAWPSAFGWKLNTEKLLRIEMVLEKNPFHISPLIHDVPESQIACPLNPLVDGTALISIPDFAAAVTCAEILLSSVVPSLFNSIISA